MCPLKELAKYIQDRPTLRRCAHYTKTKSDLTRPPRPSMFKSEELILETLRYANFRSLVSSTKVSTQFARVARTVIKERVAIALRPLIPKSGQESFFQELTMSQGLIFGDVPLQIIANRFWRPRELYISVPWKERLRILLWFARYGYVNTGVHDYRLPYCETFVIAHMDVSPNICIYTIQSPIYRISIRILSASRVAALMLMRGDLLCPQALRRGGASSLPPPFIAITVTSLSTISYWQKITTTTLIIRNAGSECPWRGGTLAFHVDCHALDDIDG